ncbi:MAG: GtrA family protein [Zoogloeaceae bacterium]|jgi:putative flippase GtrA|nr:GtrA family protein [Zoogloeaceae bacterium]
MKPFFDFWKNNQKARFLVVGVWNTLFGYAFFVILYGAFGNRDNYLVITVISHFVAVAQAFVFHKYIVFRSSGRVVREFLKFNLSYSAAFVLGIALIFFFVDKLGFHPVIGQGFAILSITILTYIVHKNFSFKHENSRIGKK